MDGELGRRGGVEEGLGEQDAVQVRAALVAPDSGLWGGIFGQMAYTVNKGAPLFGVRKPGPNEGGCIVSRQSMSIR